MPFYQIYHSYPLSDEQKETLASRITTLHCQSFKTPESFVHIRFFPETNYNNDYFVAGKPHSNTSNRIVGLVRTSASRSKESFDSLAQMIEYNWYYTLGINLPEHSELWTAENEKKRLIMVTFTPMVALREAGMTIPEAGNDLEWLEEQSPHIQNLANKHVPGFAELSDEIKSMSNIILSETFDTFVGYHVYIPITSAPESGKPSPVTQGQESASTTLTIKAVPTNEAEVPRSTEDTASSRTGEESSKPVNVSGADRYQVMTWT